MNKLLVICGPTATGKTALGIKLAKKFSSRGRPASGWKGEIISADSRQVYRGMDIGTGKDVGNVKFQISNFKSIPNDKFQIGYYKVRGVKIWLYDVVEPNREFSVADYYKLAWKVIEDIWQRGKMPILVGGTGFYIKAVIEGIESLGIPPDGELRGKLSNYPIIQLSKYLQKLDPKRWRKMNESDRKNPRRLIRAIEIAAKVKSEKLKVKSYSSKLKVKNCLLIGLMAPYKVLYERIDRRVDERVKKGAVEEVKRFLEKDYGWNLPSMSGHGYGEWRPYFEGKQSFKETIQRWKYDEHGYARRQMSWFRKALSPEPAEGSKGQWFDITQKDFDKKIEKVIQSFLASNV